MTTALLRRAEQHFREIIGGAGPRPPRLDRIRVDFAAILDGVVVELRFRDRAPLCWRVSQAELHAFWLDPMALDPRRRPDHPPPATISMSDVLVRELESLWERCLAAASQLQRINAVRAILFGAEPVGSPVWYDELAALERRVFASLALPPATPAPDYTIGVDLAAGEDTTRTTIVYRGGLRMVDYQGITVVVHEPAQPPPDAAGLMERLADFTLRTMEQAFGLSFRGPDPDAKGTALLREWLTPEQRRRYDADQSFIVVGAQTGRRYRIRRASQWNVEELDDRGERVRELCFLPIGQLVPGDCMLAQKVALETDELAALGVANSRPGPGYLFPSGRLAVDGVVVT